MKILTTGITAAFENGLIIKYPPEGSPYINPQYFLEVQNVM
jgi:hypothetical protein